MEPPATPLAASTLETLRRTQPWLRFIGIMLLIGTGVTLLLGIAMCGIGLVATGLLGEDGERQVGPGLVVLGLLYIPLALVYLYPGMLLLRSASRIRQAVADGDALAILDSLEAQRKFWKYIGICLIALVTFSAAAMLVAIFLPAFKHLG